MATKIFDNDFAEKTQTPDPNDTLLIADHTQSGNPVRKMKMSTLFNPLQTQLNQDVSNLQMQINTMLDNVLPIEERYNFQMTATYNGDKPIDLFNPIYIVSQGCIITKTSDYVARTGIPDITIERCASILSVKPNTTCQLFANNVVSFRAEHLMLDSIMLLNNTNNPIDVDISNSPLKNLNTIGLPGLNNLKISSINVSEIDLNFNLSIRSIYADNLPECTSIYISNPSLLETVGLTDCPKFSVFNFDGTFEKLVVINFFNSPLVSLDTVMAVGYAWASRAGKDAGSLRITTAIFNAMTQGQKNLFINKNINILHE